MLTKTCSKCVEAKPIAAFSRCARNKDGLHVWCKTCDHAHYVANRERKAARDAARWATKKAELGEKNRVWRMANKNMLSTYHAAYKKANKEKISAQKAAWRAAHPEIIRIYSHNRRAKKKESGDKLSVDLQSRLYKIQRGKCACCGKPLGADYHLDHIMPLALGGANKDSNIQLLRSGCNQQKWTKHPIDFMQSRGFLL